MRLLRVVCRRFGGIVVTIAVVESEGRRMTLRKWERRGR
jgi:hypothetical protein